MNDRLDRIENKVDNIQQTLLSDRQKVQLHPVLFIILVIAFFVTMDLWAYAAHRSLQAFHPLGKLSHLEYLMIATIAILLLVWATNASGIRIKMIGGG